MIPMDGEEEHYGSGSDESVEMDVERLRPFIELCSQAELVASRLGLPRSFVSASVATSVSRIQRDENHPFSRLLRAASVSPSDAADILSNHLRLWGFEASEQSDARACMQLGVSLVALGALHVGPHNEEQQEDLIGKAMSWPTGTPSQFFMALALNRDILRMALGADGSFEGPIQLQGFYSDANELFSTRDAGEIKNLLERYFQTFRNAKDGDVEFYCPAVRTKPIFNQDMRETVIGPTALHGDYTLHVNRLGDGLSCGDINGAIQLATFVDTSACKGPCALFTTTEGRLAGPYAAAFAACLRSLIEYI